MAERSVNPVFVGRERENAELHAALEHARAGRGQLVLLAGEPGIGKTRLSEKVATAAGQHGVFVLTGRCWEGAGAPAFWPWRQIVRTCLQQCDNTMLSIDLGTNAAAIAQVFPEVGDAVANLPSLPELSTEHVRFRFFDSFTTFLKNLAIRQPVLLILDDLHWADTSSVLLLQFLARELHQMRVLVLGAYRDTDVDRERPLSNALGMLARESKRIVLSGFASEEIARLIEAITGFTPAAGLVTAVHAQTEGNPFFVNEIVRLLEAEGRLATPDGLMGQHGTIPQGVRETIRQRLARLSVTGRQTLSVAAVIGREFSLELLTPVSQAATNADVNAVFAAVQEALTTRMLTDVPQEVGRYRFIHALVQETLYKDLPLPDRVRLHREVGEAIEQAYAAYLRPHFAELADHFFKAAAGGNVEKAIHYASQAGERSTALLAYEEAITHYQRALQMLELKGPDETQRCKLLIALGDAQLKAGETKQARSTFQQAADIARASNLPGQFARAALGFAGRSDVATRFDAPMTSLLEEGLTVLPEEDSVLRTRVLSHLATALYFSPFQERRAVLSQQAVEMARRLGDTPTLASALSARHMALLGPDSVRERVPLATEVVRLAEEANRKESALTGHLWCLMDFLELGDAVAVRRELQAYINIAEELRQPFYLWNVTILRATWALLTGRFGEAERLIQEGLALGQRAQTPNAFLIFGIQLFGLRREQGRLQEIEDAVKGFVDRYPAIPAWRTVLAFLYSELNRAAEAQGEFERLAANKFADLPRDQQWLPGMALLAQTAAFLHDTQRAETLYELLIPYADRLAVVGSANDCYGSVSRYLGILALTLSRWDDAARHFKAALATNVQMGARPFVAHTQYEYACMLFARNQPGDSAQAQVLLDEALATAQELTMSGLEEKIQLQVQSSKFKVQSSESGSQESEEENQKAKGKRQKAKVDSQSSVPSTQHPAPNTFHQEGDYWTIGYNGTVVRLKDMKGLQHLACLLREPGREFHVMALIAMTDTLPPYASTPNLRALADDSLTLSGMGHHARERDAETEKARKAVAHRMRTVLTKLQRIHPALWRHLFASLKTGTFCSYSPEKPATWQG